MKPQPLVSVVTPVYNTEKYLPECIESVLGQTYQNWEYVIVNNCSTDNSLKIIESYASKDNRIRLFNNIKFLKQFQNWNHAMRQISSDSTYCKVVHADDWLFPDCISQMVDLGEKYPNAGIIGAYRLDENHVNLDGLPYTAKLITGKEACRLFFLKGVYLFGSPTSILIRSEIVRSRNNFYSENNIHADQECCFAILKEWDFGFLHQVLTFTRRHNESVTSFNKSFKTYKIGDIISFMKFGRYYLDKNEFQRVYKYYLKRYYLLLGESLFNHIKKGSIEEGKNFFRYHKDSLSGVGLSINRFKVFVFLLIFIYNGILRKLSFQKKSEAT